MTKKRPKRDVVEVHEEAVFAVENGITHEELWDLIRKLGNDREILVSAAPF
ncbi:hypothetical protein BPNPMPFG_000312 [Mesorhizobium sp. AR07]|uniref:hypothetical protein n=1 Tax=Mesorhizobium sp. AR07 TaxID=2865838 RepID=UPI00215ECCCB|nr:hypothetical protein [Mesorhizobium sp. AR07]UVK44847.1 hypothetical protein BPNPMPFG_000312 [Mesorhizobium sp. AR07]